MDIRTAMQEYLENIRHLRPHTQEGYKQRLEVFCDWCEAQEKPVHLEEIKKPVVDMFVEHLRETHRSHYTSKPELSTSTLVGYVRCILCFLNWCVESEEFEQYLKLSVVKRIKKPKMVKTVIETFTAAQLKALFAACDKEFDEHLRIRDLAMLYLLIDTGIRANELCTLTITNTHLGTDDPYIKILGKGQKWREVGLGKQSLQSILDYANKYRQGAKPTETLFINRYHRPLTVWGLERIMDRLGKWAKIKDVRCSPHTMRHSFAVAYLLQGGDVFKLSLLMGHEDIEITQRYLRTVHSRQARQGKSVLDTMGLK